VRIALASIVSCTARREPSMGCVARRAALTSVALCDAQIPRRPTSSNPSFRDLHASLPNRAVLHSPRCEPRRSHRCRLFASDDVDEHGRARAVPGTGESPGNDRHRLGRPASPRRSRR
jgi:hypothetical protein